MGKKEGKLWKERNIGRKTEGESAQITPSNYVTAPLDVTNHCRGFLPGRRIIYERRVERRDFGAGFHANRLTIPLTSSRDASDAWQARFAHHARPILFGIIAQLSGSKGRAIKSIHFTYGQRPTEFRHKWAKEGDFYIPSLGKVEVWWQGDLSSSTPTFVVFARVGSVARLCV